MSPPAPSFGTPPSGEVPILYNDQHVYTKPDKLKQGRVLAALIKGGTILVPLRSMFEQMGGTVTYNGSTKTVDVSKPGVDVQVTLGKNEVVLNGETRPLDVPPEMYKGSIVVPVRVISEALGAYVLWVADKRLVVVRYLPAPPPATPAPATAIPATPPPAATAAPTPPPTPTPSQRPPAEFFVAGDGIFDPKIYDDFINGTKGKTTFGGRAGFVIPANALSILAEATYNQYTGTHTGTVGAFPGAACGIVGNPGAGDSSCVSVLGPIPGSSYVAPFDLRDNDLDGRLGLGISQRIYLVGSYERKSGNYGYPVLAGLGGGIEKVPNFKQLFDIYGSVVYYPSIQGHYLDTTGAQQTLAYRYLKYQAGVTLSPASFPIFLEAGFVGNHAGAKLNAPGATAESGVYAGLGLHF